MAAERVVIVHPDVEGPASVPESALGQYVRAGWRPKSEVDAEAAEAKKKSRRTTSEES